jgi:hypothetical protein
MRYYHRSMARTAMILAAALITTAVTSFVIASTIAPPAAATTASSITTRTTNTTTSPSSSTGIELLFHQPVYREIIPNTNITATNQTHATFTFSGNGMLILPNTTQAISTTSNGTGVISFITSSGYAKKTIMTEGSNETITGTFYEIVRFNPSTSTKGIGIVIAVFHTNSTGMLATLNGTIAAGINTVNSSGESNIALWRWESDTSDIGEMDNINLPHLLPPLPVNSESRRNTTTITNATAYDMNAWRGMQGGEIL